MVRFSRWRIVLATVGLLVGITASGRRRAHLIKHIAGYQSTTAHKDPVRFGDVGSLTQPISEVPGSRTVSFVRRAALSRLAGICRGMKESWEVARLAPSAARRLRNVILILWMKWITPTDRPPAAAVRLSLTYRADCVDLWVRGESDIAVAHSIFVQDIYGKLVGRSPSAILDLGANIGASAIAFGIQFPQAQIIACEPDPRSFALLRRNTAHIHGIRLRRVAIGDHDGQADFLASSSWQASRLTREVDDCSHDDSLLSVDCMLLTTLVSIEGIENIELVKMDIEGAEIAAARSILLVPGVSMVVGEFHEQLTGRVLTISQTF